MYITLLQCGRPRLRLPQSPIVHVQCAFIPSLAVFQSKLSTEAAQASVISRAAPCSCALPYAACPRTLASHPRAHKTYSSYHSMVRSQLLILKTYEISAFQGLLGTLNVIKNRQLTAGSLGSRGRTCSTP